jgi:hypothetical protein
LIIGRRRGEGEGEDERERERDEEGRDRRKWKVWKVVKTAGGARFIYAEGGQSGRRRAPNRKKDRGFRRQRPLKVNYI